MNKGFLFIGAIIFAVYLYLLFYIIFKGHKAQKKNHYPDLTKQDIMDAYEEGEKK